MQLILILCGFSYAKTDSCGTDNYPCNCCENGFTDCIIPLPEECITLADRENSEILSYKGYANNYINITAISEKASEYGTTIERYMKFLMKTPLMLDSILNALEEITQETSTPFPPPTPDILLSLH